MNTSLSASQSGLLETAISPIRPAQRTAAKVVGFLYLFQMATAIFDANRDVYLKHFGRSFLARTKWRAMFGLWKFVALLRARLRGHRQVRPV